MAILDAKSAAVTFFSDRPRSDDDDLRLKEVSVVIEPSWSFFFLLLWRSLANEYIEIKWNVGALAEVEETGHDE